MSTTQKIAILGSGVVGEALAAGFTKHGHEVKRVSRAAFAEAARWGDVVVLAVKGSAAESALELAGAANLAGKTIIDPTNPIADAPPDHGVLKFFTNLDDSLMEKLQRKVPDAHFVKAFSCVGSAWMVNPDFGGQTPTMFICGNDVGAKTTVRGILELFGWDVEDMGTAPAARAIEPLSMLWCIPGLTHNKWTHAFKLLRK